MSQMSLEERKTKKVSQKNSTRKKAVSAVATERTNWQIEEHTARPPNKRESMISAEFLSACTCMLSRTVFNIECRKKSGNYLSFGFTATCMFRDSRSTLAGK